MWQRLWGAQEMVQHETILMTKKQYKLNTFILHLGKIFSPNLAHLKVLFPSGSKFMCLRAKVMNWDVSFLCIKQRKTYFTSVGKYQVILLVSLHLWLIPIHTLHIVPLCPDNLFYFTDHVALQYSSRQKQNYYHWRRLLKN